jgi:hypothetical protein
MTSKTAEQTSSSEGKWSVVVESVWFPCLGSIPDFQVYASEQAARRAFKKLRGPRILVDDSGDEVLAATGAPWMKRALRTMRKELKHNSSCLPPLSSRNAGYAASCAASCATVDLCDMDEYAFSDDGFLSDDFAGTAQAVELPRKKRLLSDSVSTDVDLESSRTARSAFTRSSVEICQSTSSSVYRLLDLGSKAPWSKSGSVDICQSTSSSAYGLLDVGSTRGSVFIEG